MRAEQIIVNEFSLFGSTTFCGKILEFICLILPRDGFFWSLFFALFYWNYAMRKTLWIFYTCVKLDLYWLLFFHVWNLGLIIFCFSFFCEQMCDWEEQRTEIGIQIVSICLDSKDFTWHVISKTSKSVLVFVAGF